jgi:hypothetical protein
MRDAPEFEALDDETRRCLTRRLRRHEQLLALWRDCTALELLSDLNVLTQLLQFRCYHDADVRYRDEKRRREHE